VGVGVHSRHRADAVVLRDWGSVVGKGQVLVSDRMRFALFPARSRRGDAAQPRFVRIWKLSPLFAGPLRCLKFRMLHAANTSTMHSWVLRNVLIIHDGYPAPYLCSNANSMLGIIYSLIVKTSPPSIQSETQVTKTWAPLRRPFCFLSYRPPVLSLPPSCLPPSCLPPALSLPSSRYARRSHHVASPQAS
jgi:hypothetical protein